MPHYTRSIAGLGAGLGLLLAGCGGGGAVSAPPAQPAPPAVDTAATAWMDGYCDAVHGFIADNNAMPAPANGARTIPEILRATSKQLGDYATILGRAVDKLTALPPAPVPAGETAKKTFLDNYTSARDKAASAKTALDAANKNDTSAQARAVDGLMAAQQDAMGAMDPVGAIKDSPELAQASARAPKCVPRG
jgi:hypothetical protein